MIKRDEDADERIDREGGETELMRRKSREVKNKSMDMFNSTVGRPLHRWMIYTAITASNKHRALDSPNNRSALSPGLKVQKDVRDCVVLKLELEMLKQS